MIVVLRRLRVTGKRRVGVRRRAASIRPAWRLDGPLAIPGNSGRDYRLCGADRGAHTNPTFGIAGTKRRKSEACMPLS